jgi:hypothetical protein
MARPSLGRHRGIYVGDSFKDQHGNDIPHGKGKVTYPTGEIQDGIWVDGVFIEGDTIKTLANGDVYAGKWYNENLHGEAVITCLNGNEIAGVWRNGQLVSVTKIFTKIDEMTHDGFLPTGSNYDSFCRKFIEDGVEITQDLILDQEGGYSLIKRRDRESFGLKIYPNGDKYIGDFNADKPCGIKGLYITSVDGKCHNVAVHVGQKFCLDYGVSGKGAVFLIPDPAGYYVGGVDLHGKKHGEVTYFDFGGSHLKATYDHGSLNGKGVYVSKDGSSVDVEFKDDILVDGADDLLQVFQRDIDASGKFRSYLTDFLYSNGSLEFTNERQNAIAVAATNYLGVNVVRRGANPQPFQMKEVRVILSKVPGHALTIVQVGNVAIFSNNVHPYEGYDDNRRIFDCSKNGYLTHKTGNFFGEMDEHSRGLCVTYSTANAIVAAMALKEMQKIPKSDKPRTGEAITAYILEYAETHDIDGKVVKIRDVGGNLVDNSDHVAERTAKGKPPKSSIFNLRAEEIIYKFEKRYNRFVDEANAAISEGDKALAAKYPNGLSQLYYAKDFDPAEPTKSIKKFSFGRVGVKRDVPRMVE